MPQRQRQKTLEALLTWLVQETEQHPVLCIVEDLHWVDPSTRPPEQNWRQSRFFRSVPRPQTGHVQLWYHTHCGSRWSSWAFASMVRQLAIDDGKEAYQQRPVDGINGQA
jgi:hypothetical protein